MKVTIVDTWANSDAGFLHRTRPSLKLLAGALAIGTIVLTWNPWVLAALAAAILASARIANLPIKPMVGLAAYPLLFSGLLVLTTDYGLASDIAILLKTFCAALAALSVGLSTPYHQIFGALGSVLHPFVNDALLMTYRSMFILADVLSNLLTTVRLRGSSSWRRPVAAVRDLGFAAGNLVLSTFDLAQADYEIMRMRGYQGRIRTTGLPPAPSVPPTLPVDATTPTPHDTPDTPPANNDR